MELKEVNEQVGEELQQVLDHLSGLGGLSLQAGYEHCIWYAGCEYCLINGKWVRRRCYV